MDEATKSITFKKEPRGEIYRALLDALADVADRALLVVRTKPLLWHATAEAIVTELRPFMIDEQEVDAWPGTQLIGLTGRVIRYRYTPECRAILQSACEGLYGWQQPGAPEDLCLLRPDGSHCLVTIAHEHDAYLELTDEEWRAFAARAPAVARLCRR